MSRELILALATLTAVGTTATGAVVLAVKTQPTTTDAANCAVGRKPPEALEILLDPTDVSSAEQNDEILRSVQTQADQVKVGGRVLVEALRSDRPYEPKLLVSICRPMAPAEANPITSTLDRVRWRYTQRFSAPIAAAVKDALNTPAQPASPILQSVTGSTWQDAFSPDQPHRTLFLASDLFHNDDEFSLYNAASAAAFPRTRLAHVARPDLRGVSVRIHLIRRPASLQAQDDVAVPFFRAWLAARGALEVHFDGAGSTVRLADAALDHGVRP